MSEVRIVISSGAEVEGVALSSSGADVLFVGMNDKQRVKELRRLVRSATIREHVLAQVGGAAADEFMNTEVTEIS